MMMFGGGFKASKCKTLLRLAMARIKLLRNKRDIQIKQLRKDIFMLLQSGQEPSARIRVEHVYREQNVMAAYDIIELFCELIAVRLPIIESQKLCPLDLKEGISSLVFASPRCADLPELLQIRTLFQAKYGKEFVSAAAELRPDCGVNRRIIEKLSVRAPSGEVKLKLLKEIAAEFNLDWDPADTEAELLKQPEDLLDGPKKFVGATMMPFPEPQYVFNKPSEKEPQLQHTPPAAASVLPPVRAAPHPAPAPSSTKSSPDSTPPDSPIDRKQFVPFVVPPPPRGPAPGRHESPQRASGNWRASDQGISSQSGKTHPEKLPSFTDDAPSQPKEGLINYENVAAAAKAAADSADRAVAAARAAAELAKLQSSKIDSADRAVAAARAAELAKVQSSKIGSVPQKVSQESDNSSSEDSGDEKERTHQERNSYPWKSSDRPREDSDSEFKKISESQERNETKTLHEGESLFTQEGAEDDVASARIEEETNNEKSQRPELFSRSESNLFKRSDSDEADLRSSDESPFYDTLQGFSRPKFDEDDVPYSRSSIKSELDFFNRRSSSPKPTFNDYWRSQTLNFPGDKDDMPISRRDSQGNSNLNNEKLRWNSGVSDSQDSSNMFSSHFDQSDKASDSFYQKTTARKEDTSVYKEPESSFPSKPRIIESKRTRAQWPARNRERSEDSGASSSGDVSLPPPPVHPVKPKVSESVEYDSSPSFSRPLSPPPGQYATRQKSFSTGLYGSPPPSPSPHEFDDSPTMANVSSTQPKGHHVSSLSTYFQRPQRPLSSFGHRHSDPNPITLSTSLSDPSPTNSPDNIRYNISPSAPLVHPKLPDYDDLHARFEALKTTRH